MDYDDIRGKIVIITGSTSGLGLHTAKVLYRHGATVVVTCRDESRGRSAIDLIQSQKTMNSCAGNLRLFSLDLSCYKSVLKFCSEVKSSFQKIDILINNAGVMGLPFELSSDGIETHFATNSFGHFVIVNQLLPLLENSTTGRIINVSSGLYKGVNYIPTLKQLMGEQDWNYQPRFAYAFSKLSNCLHAVELARRLDSKQCSTKVYTVRPGFIRGTELGRETHWLLRSLATPIIWLLSRSLDQGIETIVYCAVKRNDELISGKFYSNCQEEEFGPMVTMENAAVLWDIYVKMEDLVLKRSTFSDQEKTRAKEYYNFLS